MGRWQRGKTRGPRSSRYRETLSHSHGSCRRRPEPIVVPSSERSGSSAFTSLEASTGVGKPPMQIGGKWLGSSRSRGGARNRGAIVGSEGVGKLSGGGDSAARCDEGDLDLGNWRETVLDAKHA